MVEQCRDAAEPVLAREFVEKDLLLGAEDLRDGPGCGMTRVVESAARLTGFATGEIAEHESDARAADFLY